MGFGLFKPANGWRDFVGEVGIIVLGVVIALSLEQGILSWNWWRQVAVSQRALREEDESAEQAKLLSLTKPLELDAGIKDHYVELMSRRRER